MFCLGLKCLRDMFPIKPCVIIFFKDAMSVSFDQHCLQLTSKPHQAVNHISVNMRNCKIYMYMSPCVLKITDMTTLLKSVAANWFCLFMV